MAYDEGLAHRLRELLEDDSSVAEKKMFGGLCFLHGGHMVCGIVGDELMLRVGPEAYDACLAEPHAREMDFTGRALRGMIYVGTDGFAEDEDLEAWVERALSYARSLPPKSAKKKAAKKRAAKKKKAAAKKGTRKR
ncbi:MAG: TfoX/Sxy family protein [bacterium]|nr:TfoX/Sxy family protein [bacterium]